MKILKKIFDFYIDSSIHVAVAVVCLVFVTVRSNHFDKHYLFATCVFFGTIIGYNFLKYSQLFSNKNFHCKKYYALLAVTFLAVIGFLSSLYLLNATTQKLVLISGLFVLMYPFFRKWGWTKLFFVSFVVTFITVYIPFQKTKLLPFDFYIIIIQRFLILISLLIPFEIMDSKTDDKSLNTLPQKFGVKKAKLFGTSLIIPFLVLEFLKSHPSYSVLPIGIMTVVLINFTTLERSKYYTSFWVESVPILWWLMLSIFI